MPKPNLEEYEHIIIGHALTDILCAQSREEAARILDASPLGASMNEFHRDLVLETCDLKFEPGPLESRVLPLP